MKYYKNSIIAFFAIVVFGTPWFVANYPNATRFVDNIFGYINSSYSAVFSRPVVTVDQLHQKYNVVSHRKNQPKIRIMLVPGHEPGYGGAEFGQSIERDMAVDLANTLEGFFKNNKHYEVIVARDKQNWNPDLEKYFSEHWNDITQFVKESKEEMVRMVSNGSIRKVADGIIHRNAPQNTALRLFGINKWSNENNVDIVIHIHFNDYPRKSTRTAGKYSGFAIYVPEKQYVNSETTRSIADSVYKRLSKYNAVSDLPKENAGVVEDQDLIAIGSNNTLGVPSMLIEYGYIYEPQFVDAQIRDLAIKDLAFQTYIGIQDFFGSGNDVSLAFDTLMLPYTANEGIDKNQDSKVKVLALQSALIMNGVYPPKNKTKNECPRTGKLGPCTMSSLNQFQNKYGIKDEENTFGEQTKKVLNDLYPINIQ